MEFPQFCPEKFTTQTRQACPGCRGHKASMEAVALRPPRPHPHALSHSLSLLAASLRLRGRPLPGSPPGRTQRDRLYDRFAGCTVLLRWQGVAGRGGAWRGVAGRCPCRFLPLSTGFLGALGF